MGTSRGRGTLVAWALLGVSGGCSDAGVPSPGGAAIEGDGVLLDGPSGTPEADAFRPEGDGVDGPADDAADPGSKLGDSAPIPDGTPADTGDPDPGPPDRGPGDLGAPCETGDDCESGYCVETHEGKVCTELCDDVCLPGWACSQEIGSGSDVAFLCVPSFPDLCYPCLGNADCSGGKGAGKNRCVPVGDEGTFCLGGCTEADCPAGFSCLEAADVEGAPALQCFPDDVSCGCTPAAIEDGAATGCESGNEHGVCPGLRTCGPEGLGPCDAPAAAPDLCDGDDDDCDGAVDEGFESAPCEIGNELGVCLGASACAGKQGEVCVVEAAVEESCDGEDDDCDGETDEAGAAGCDLWFADADGDTFGTGDGACLCAPDPAASLTASQAGDCADDDAGVHPGLPEACNGKDDDCDGATDEADAVGCQVFLLDQDADGFGKDGAAACLCGPDPASGFTATKGGDCDDEAAGANPGAAEVCNETDDDCDGAADEPDADGCVFWFADTDLDGYGHASAFACLCKPSGKLVVTKGGDCDDLDPAKNPGAAEACNGVDDDCDGLADESGALGCDVLHADGDGDGFGKPGDLDCFCAPEGAYTASQGGDCDDQVALVNPAAAESCNGKDDDCDGSVDEEGAAGCETFHADKDADGAGDPGSAKCLCDAKLPFVSTLPTDCDDTKSTVKPGAPEVCNQLDDDCDGEVDEGVGGSCSPFYLDQDGDGFGVDDDAKCLCGPEGSYTATQPGDCDDGDAAVSPGLVETCDGKDDDCNGETDEPGAQGCDLLFADADGDGFGASGSAACLCAPAGVHTAVLGGDCDDGTAEVSPDAFEACNDQDDDCDGQTDETGAAGCEPFWPDGDGDGFGASGDPTCLCDPKGKLTAKKPGDCDDGKSAVNPLQVEACNGQDDDCDGAGDEAGAQGCSPLFADGDGDGYGLPGSAKCLCAPSGTNTAAVAGDCDDGDPGASPGAEETCDGDDDDCDGKTDEANAHGCKNLLVDEDGDGFGVPESGVCLCAPDGVHVAAKGGDCDDASTQVNPGALEACNQVDDDCDGAEDEDGALGCELVLLDADGDGFGVSGLSRCACDPEPPWTATAGGDCLDTDADVNPDAAEVCNGADDDCDGAADEAGATGCTPFFEDGDADGFGKGGVALCLCGPTGTWTATNGKDCDDADPAVKPGAGESCNEVDDDCDGKTDEQNAFGCQAWLLDGDGDGFGKAGSAKCLCGPEAPYSAAVGGDCQDGNASVNPGAPEVCGGGDEDCDGVPNENGASGCILYMKDGDEDGAGVAGDVLCACQATFPYTATSGGDCNDGNPAVKPGASESCNGTDDDCDGAVDEADAGGCTTWFLDGDGDGWGKDGETACLCASKGAFTAVKGGDCDDATALRSPGLAEACNGYDDDCDQVADEEGAQGCVLRYLDADLDGFGADGSGACLCDEEGQFTATKEGDCDDGEDAVNPSIVETCNAVDDDCDVVVDEGCGLPVVGWPTYKYGQRRTGHSLGVQGPAKSSLRWKKQLGQGIVHNSVALPDDGTVIAAVGSKAWRLDLADGQVLWEIDLPDAVDNRASPTLRIGGTILVPAGDTLLMLYPDGGVIWSLPFQGETITSAPIVDGVGTIYVVSSAAARRISTGGEVVWTTNLPNNLKSPGHPALGPNGRVHFAGSNHTVYALDPTTGTAAWTFSKAGADTDGTVAIAETGDVYQSFSAEVVGLTPAGVQFASVATGGDIDSDVAIFNTGYQCCNPQDFVLVSPNGATGLRKYSATLVHQWTAALTKHQSWNSTPVFDLDGDAFVGTDAKSFVSVTQAGAIKWSFATDHTEVDSTAAIGPGFVVFGDDSGTLYCVGD